MPHSWHSDSFFKPSYECTPLTHDCIGFCHLKHWSIPLPSLLCPPWRRPDCSLCPWWWHASLPWPWCCWAPDAHQTPALYSGSQLHHASCSAASRYYEAQQLWTERFSQWNCSSYREKESVNNICLNISKKSAFISFVCAVVVISYVYSCWHH